MTAFMRSADAFTWAMEVDPRLRSTIVTVLILDRLPDWSELRNRMCNLSVRLPMFRQRIVESPLKAPPRWQDTTDFDLDFHMRRTALPADGAFESVLELARIAQMESLDRARPLWKITLIEGLPAGEAAVLCVFHHALSDGVGGVQIAMALFGNGDLPSEGRTPAHLSTGYFAEMAGTGSDRRSEEERWNFDGSCRPVHALRSSLQLAASVYRTVRPINSTGSALMTHRSLCRTLATLEISMPRLREAGHRGGGALNDAFVAGVAGGLRLYHERHDYAVDALHVTMPISIRTASDAPGGNRITLMRFDVPAGLADPAERVRRIHKSTDHVRHEKSLPHTQAVARFLNLMPRWYIGSILRHVDFLASDVPGIPVPVTLCGAEVRRQFAFGPTIGTAVNVTLLTYVDTCEIGIDIDTGAIPDADCFIDCLRGGFDEVLRLADG